MGKESGGGAEELESPRGRVKFLCSYGGKIMPRPFDGHLKYVGGETRVLAAPRDITFSELMKKLSAEFEGDMILKYQVLHEDLDVLVSVRTNEDLKHMLDEYDRHESKGAPKLRTFLFPANPLAVENQTSSLDPHVAEQRYIDAVNGMARTTPSVRLPPINANRPIFSFSPGSSPKSKSSSPESNPVDYMQHEPTFIHGHHSSGLPMTKVRSSPNLSSLNSQPCQTNNVSNYQYQYHHHPYHHHQQPQQQQSLHGYQFSRPAYDPHRLSPCPSLRRSDHGKAPIGNGKYCISGHNGGSGSSRYRYYDEHSVYSLPPSPRQRFLE